MTSFAQTRSTFKKLVEHEICTIKSSIHWWKLRINIAYSSCLQSNKTLKSLMTSFAHTALLRMIHAEFSPLCTGTTCAYILLIATEKLEFENFNDVIRAYRKYFKKVVQHDICRIKSFIHWRKLRICIANNSGEIGVWTFQWRHLRIPEVLSKKLLQHNICRI